MLQYTIFDRVKRPFIIYKDTNANRYCLEPRKGKNRNRTCLITYHETNINLMRDILETFDMCHVRVNYDLNVIHDYRFLSDDEQIRFSRKYDTYTFNINDTIEWIMEGQFIDSNIKFNSEFYIFLRDTNYITYLFKRNLRECVVEHAKKKIATFGSYQCRNTSQSSNKHEIMNEYIKTPYCGEIVECVKMMMPWYTNNTFEVIRYEDIIGLNDTAEQYSTILKLMEDHNIENITMEQINNRCIGKHKPYIINWEEYWDERAEEWFNATGLYDLNLRLGYENM